MLDEDKLYKRSLLGRVRTSTGTELEVLLAFFDCLELRARHVDLVLTLQAELVERGVCFP